MAWWLLLMTLDDPLPTTTYQEHHVFVIEHNTTYDDAGKPVLRQYICWAKYPNNQLHVVAWWISKGERVAKVLHGGTHYMVLKWRGNELHVIRAGVYKQSHTLHDPELFDREVVATKDRMELWK